MKYRDILGIPNKKKKKIVKEEVKQPSIKDILEEQFGPTAKAFGNRNVQMKTDTGPKRWTGSGLTEFEQQGGKDNVNEGPAYEYAGIMKNIEKAENVQAKQVNNLVKLLQKKGLKKEASTLASTYMKSVRDFDSFLKKLERSLI